MFRVNKLWLGSHVVGVFHGVGCVDHIYLQRERSLKSAYCVPKRETELAADSCAALSGLWTVLGANRSATCDKKKIKSKHLENAVTLMSPDKKHSAFLITYL
jgi:hypothetical protein